MDKLDILHQFILEINAIEKEYIDVKYEKPLWLVQTLHPTIRNRLYNLIEYYSFVINKGWLEKEVQDFILPTLMEYIRNIYIPNMQEDVLRLGQDTKYIELEVLYNKYTRDSPIVHKVTIGQGNQDEKEGDGASPHSQGPQEAISHLHNIEQS